VIEVRGRLISEEDVARLKVLLLTPG